MDIDIYIVQIQIHIPGTFGGTFGGTFTLTLYLFEEKYKNIDIKMEDFNGCRD